MTKTASDVMQTQVLTVSPNDPLHTVQRLFFEEGIHGAPVVDDQGRVQGIITSTDILRAATDAHELGPREPDFYGDAPGLPPDVWSDPSEDFQARLRESIVSDVMTNGVLSVAPDADVSEVAHAIVENRIHRVLVIDRNHLCGIVSTYDLVKLLDDQS